MPNSDFNDSSASDANSGTSQTSSALSGAASGAAAGAVFGPWGAVIGGVVGGVVGYFSAPKKPVYKPINVDAIVSEARQNYSDNYKNSLALEGQYNPASASARANTDLALNDAAKQTSAGFKARNKLLDDVTGADNPLLRESSDRILQQLRQGGNLDPETQAAVTRGALQRGGQSGITGSEAGRGLVARDLGLTSIGLQQSRQATAQSAGGLMEQLGLARLSAASGAAGQDASTAAALGNIFNARGLPDAGLNPEFAAKLRVANATGQNKIDLATLTMENKARSKNVSSVLSLGSGYAGMMGKGGTGESTDDWETRG